MNEEEWLRLTPEGEEAEDTYAGYLYLPELKQHHFGSARVSVPSDMMSRMWLSNAELRAIPSVAALVEALLLTRGPGGCWCEAQFAPSGTIVGHSSECKQIRAALLDLGMEVGE